MIQKETNELLVLLRDIKNLLEKQSELLIKEININYDLANVTNKSNQTKITIVGDNPTQTKKKK
tara:strand:- start:614 stop:805 length:192 start_codon:yes stop_codon:yes gene_type:complete